jgi:hypothetical protein
VASVADCDYDSPREEIISKLRSMGLWRDKTLCIEACDGAAFAE